MKPRVASFDKTQVLRNNITKYQIHFFFFLLLVCDQCILYKICLNTWIFFENFVLILYPARRYNFIALFVTFCVYYKQFKIKGIFIVSTEAMN